MRLEKNDVILFNGDSITDAGRNRSELYSLAGYTKLITDAINVMKPELCITAYNRGISGDTTKMLLDRLESELQTLKPTVLSILIGINDVWRRYDSNIITTEQTFEQNYCNILDIAKKYLSKIILIEPFLLSSDAAKLKFREDLEPKIKIVRKLAKQNGIELIEMDRVFAELCNNQKPSFFSIDGVHIEYEGNLALAREWVKKVLT